jgi:hypothetical protein
MLHKMRQPVQTRRLITATRIHRHTAMLHRHRNPPRHNPQPVAEPMILNHLVRHKNKEYLKGSLKTNSGCKDTQLPRHPPPQPHTKKSMPQNQNCQFTKKL